MTQFRFGNMAFPKKLKGYSSQKIDLSDPIDIVIPWVDMTSKKWQANFEKFSKTKIDPSRYKSYGELELTLHSINKYMPWVRNMFLVTDNQIPPSYVFNYPKLKVIDHSEILGSECIAPTFNSCVIEAYLHRIPGLSECFLYANDDTAVGRPVKKEFFFKDDLPCVSFLKRSLEWPIKEYNWHVYNTIKLIGSFSKNYPGYSNGDMLWGIHQIGIMRKESHKEIWKVFNNELKKLVKHRIRNHKNMFEPCMLSRFMGICNGGMSFRIEPKSSYKSKWRYTNPKAFYKSLLRERPMFYCINFIENKDVSLFNSFKKEIMSR